MLSGKKHWLISCMVALLLKEVKEQNPARHFKIFTRLLSSELGSEGTENREDGNLHKKLCAHP